MAPEAPPPGRGALVVGAGCALGALLRHAASLAPAPDWFGLLGVNALGCLALGFLSALPRWRRHPRAALFVGPGLLGGFTSVSAWNWNTVALIEAGRPGAAGLNVALTVTLCLLTAAGGRALARRRGSDTARAALP